jgi:hypothetical protein
MYGSISVCDSKIQFICVPGDVSLSLPSGVIQIVRTVERLLIQCRTDVAEPTRRQVPVVVMKPLAVTFPRAEFASSNARSR